MTSLDNPPKFHQRQKTAHTQRSMTSSREQKTNTEKLKQKVQNQSEDEFFHPDLPKVWTIHDSVLKKIDRRRLGKAYGFHLKMSKAYTINEAKTELTKQCCESPDAIILHVGINDLQRDTAENCSAALVDLVNVACDHYK